MIDCSRETGTRRWAPQAQALVEIVTSIYTRGPRIACGCRSRRLVRGQGGRLVIYGEGKLGAPPPLPIETTVADFQRDSAHDEVAWKAADRLTPGAEIVLPGIGFPCLTMLNPVQAWSLWEAPKSDGILGLLAVGSGKSIISILIALAFQNCRNAVLLAEPSQRVHYRLFYLRLREHFRVPSIVFDKPDMAGSFIVDGTPVVHFRPYSLLSQPKSTEMLERLHPDLIICDEAHRVARRENASSRRLLRYLIAHNDENPRLCAWSGTLVKKSVKDISHLSAFSLGLNSPYPISPDDAEAWAAVLDPSPVPDTNSSTARSLRKAFGRETTGIALLQNDNSDIREGLRSRVTETQGVITTTGSSAAVPIYIHEFELPSIPDLVREKLTDARKGNRADGEELVDQFEIARCVRETSSGFHYYWFFPAYAAAKDDAEREQVARHITEWYAARKAFFKELRVKLQHPQAHLDSPLLCMHAAERAWRTLPYDGDLPVWPAKAWPAWVAIKDTVKHESRTKWIDDYFAQACAEWARKHRGIVWYLNSALGQRIAEILGVPCHGGGPDAETAIMAEDGSRSIVASIKAHGSGRDGLQFKFHEQLVAELPSSNLIYEQLFGRLCRDGQTEDAIHTWVPLHVGENKDALRAALRESEFVEQQTGNQQMLLIADYEFEL